MIQEDKKIFTKNQRINILIEAQKNYVLALNRAIVRATHKYPSISIDNLKNSLKIAILRIDRLQSLK